jgi:hypothetical protein
MAVEPLLMLRFRPKKNPVVLAYQLPYFSRLIYRASGSPPTLQNILPEQH